jgi:uncharacterized membrane protein
MHEGPELTNWTISILAFVVGAILLLLVRRRR